VPAAPIARDRAGSRSIPETRSCPDSSCGDDQPRLTCPGSTVQV
jgi:hypothetical protein